MENIEDLLKKWGLETLIPAFEEHAVSLEALKQILDDNDHVSLGKLIPQVGFQALLKKNFFKYLESQNPDKTPEVQDTQKTPEAQDTQETPEAQDIQQLINNDVGNRTFEDEQTMSENSSCETPQIYFLNNEIEYKANSASTSNAHVIIEVSEMPSSPSSILSLNSSVNSDRSFRRKYTDSLQNVDVKNILDQNCYGEAVIKFYEKNKHLTPRYQRYLVDVLITYLITNRKEFGFLSNSSWDLLSDKIVELFPLEEKTSYYIPPVKKSHNKFNKSGIARGKLPDKYKNELALLRESGVLPKMESRAETDSCDEFSETAADETSDEILNSKTWLQHHSEPFDDVLKHWTETHKFRMNQLADSHAFNTVSSILTEWPILKHNFGYVLIEKDFDTEYPEKGNHLFTKFSEVFDAALQLKKKTCVNTDNEFLVDLLEGELSADSRTLIQIYLLCSFICNKSLKVKKWKPSVAESRESIILQVKTPDQIEEAISLKREKAKKYGTTLQPFAIAEAPSITKVLASYCYIDGVLYKTNSLLHALDICFKAFIVFNASYPRESEHIWYLLQVAVYELQTKFDNKIPYVLDFIKLIKQS